MTLNSPAPCQAKVVNCHNPDGLRWGQMDDLSRTKMHHNLRDQKTPVRNKDMEWYLPTTLVTIGSGLTLPASASSSEAPAQLDAQIAEAVGGHPAVVAETKKKSFVDLDTDEEEMATDSEAPREVPRPPRTKPTAYQMVQFSTFGARKPHVWAPG
jgi:hypothetical protein